MIRPGKGIIYCVNRSALATAGEGSQATAGSTDLTFPKSLTHSLPRPVRAIMTTQLRRRIEYRRCSVRINKRSPTRAGVACAMSFSSFTCNN